MATVTNKTRRPLKVPLPAGKTLRLGPLGSAEMSAKATRHPPVLKLVEAGTLEIQEGTGTNVRGGPPASTSGRSGLASGSGGGIRKTGDR